MTDHLAPLRAALAGHYEIERVLGTGGMATVYLAKDVKHNRQVAVKVLKEDLSAALAGPRFVREIGIAASLAHPHILPVHDSGDADGRLYYVMPFVAGESLRQRLSRLGPLPYTEALAIAREVAAALEYAHGMGVVHRDIKPENILIVEGRVWVADFGIARAVSAAGGDALTRPGMVIGTPGYMSPEQARGHDRVDGRSDVYSLGCVLHEMLTGRLPDPSTDWGADTPAASAPALGVPRHVRRALGRALATKPADRFRSAGELRDALADHAGASRLSVLARTGAVAALAVAFAVAGFALLLDRAQARPAPAARAPMLLVLPFENLGGPEDDFFASGATDEITARLAKVRGLGIIARQTALQYRQSQKTAMQIGTELGVDYILEATVSFQHTAGGVRRVRIRPQLIRTSDAVHLWADTYTDDLHDVFAVQDAIAERVARALHVALIDRPPDTADRPTANLDAYLAYLRGNEHYNRGWSDETHLRNALAGFEEAVALDSTFAVALAKLSMALSALYFGRFDERVDVLARARDAAQRAVALDPDLPEAHLALGLYYYRGGNRYELALQEFNVALAERPNDSDVLEAAAYVHRRQGHWDEAVRLLERALVYDPRSPHRYLGLINTLSMLRRWDDAERVTRTWRSRSPESGSWPSVTAQLAVLRSGQIDEARRMLRTVDPHADPTESLDLRWWVAYLEGDYPRAMNALAVGRVSRVIVTWAARPVGGDSASLLLLRAALLRLMDRRTESAATFDTAATRLTALIARDSANAWLHRDLGVALAGAGRPDAALRAARRAVELLPVEGDAVAGAVMLEGMALVFTLLGRQDDAIELLAYVLAIPSNLSAGLIAVDPAWAPLRTHPRFRTLAAEL